MANSLFGGSPSLRILPWLPDGQLRPLPVRPPVAPGPIDRADFVEGIELIAEQIQALVAIMRQAYGPALDDAALARAGVNLQSPTTLPEVISARVYTAGEIVRLNRPARMLDVFNLGSGDLQVRIYGVTVPGPGQAFNALPLTATLIIPAGQGLHLDALFTRGLFVVNAGTFQVVAR